MVLNKLKEKMAGLTPEQMSILSGGDFSNMTVRRALSGKGIDLLKAKAIAKVLKVKLDDLNKA